MSFVISSFFTRRRAVEPNSYSPASEPEKKKTTAVEDKELSKRMANQAAIDKAKMNSSANGTLRFSADCSGRHGLKPFMIIEVAPR